MLDRESILFAVIRNFAAIGAIVIILYVIRYMDVKDAVSKYLSKISPEIYFYHMPIALLLSRIIENSLVFALSVTVATFIIAPIINLWDKWLNKKIKALAHI